MSANWVNDKYEMSASPSFQQVAIGHRASSVQAPPTAPVTADNRPWSTTTIAIPIRSRRRSCLRSRLRRRSRSRSRRCRAYYVPLDVDVVGVVVSIAAHKQAKIFVLALPKIKYPCRQ